jgi:hypothetical protein
MSAPDDTYVSGNHVRAQCISCISCLSCISSCQATSSNLATCFGSNSPPAHLLQLRVAMSPSPMYAALYCHPARVLLSLAPHAGQIAPLVYKQASIILMILCLALLFGLAPPVVAEFLELQLFMNDLSRRLKWTFFIMPLLRPLGKRNELSRQQNKIPGGMPRSLCSRQPAAAAAAKILGPPFLHLAVLVVSTDGYSSAKKRS